MENETKYFANRRVQGDFVNSLVRQLKFKREDFRTIGNLGLFTSLIDLGNFAIAFNTDNVGTKSIVAEMANKYDTIGIDCVAMNVNDTITSGAEPVAMVDYIELNEVDPEVARQIGVGLNVGAQMANITIVGGETSIVPDLVKHIDLAGTVFGIVQKNQIISGENITDGDLIFALGSSGLHSNGFTTVRKIIADNGISLDSKFPGDNKKTMEVLLEPTRIYVREVLDILDVVDVKGMANITGGGVRNITRLKDMKYVIDSPMEPQNVFTRILEMGKIPYSEAYETFNMGMGFMLIIDPESKRDLINRLRNKVNVREVGHVENGSGIEIAPYEVTYTGYY
ncbi:MAG: phosphoribosylformylglycinamidine cyclo-ligase [Candidatus Thermoplasmatota archaeon]|jgi:phosphoribosylformylglycinamidine cyclo-ligase|nr:phosphoribosylformylglycinamidine cyclo-ligase [Candidatus Thermoplasmatota archaeon]MCL5793206.1 phosphoribosylformylglycinamidine cyclo-ligase [Candidatus Thermoplasmatota archaeon]